MAFHDKIIREKIWKCIYLVDRLKRCRYKKRGQNFCMLKGRVSN